MFNIQTEIFSYVSMIPMEWQPLKCLIPLLQYEVYSRITMKYKLSNNLTLFTKRICIFEADYCAYHHLYFST